VWGFCLGFKGFGRCYWICDGEFKKTRDWEGEGLGMASAALNQIETRSNIKQAEGAVGTECSNSILTIRRSLSEVSRTEFPYARLAIVLNHPRMEAWGVVGSPEHAQWQIPTDGP